MCYAFNKDEVIKVDGAAEAEGRIYPVSFDGESLLVVVIGKGTYIIVWCSHRVFTLSQRRNHHEALE